MTSNRAGEDHGPRSRRVSGLFGRYAIVLVLVLAVAVFSLLRPATFFTFANLATIVGARAILLMVALAVTIPLAAGDFDLSIGFVLGFSMSLVGVLVVLWGWPVLVAVMIALLAGVVVGLVHALFIVKIGVNAFVVTLATGTLLLGLTRGLTDGRTISGIPESLTVVARTQLFGIRAVAWYALALALLLWYLMEHTPLGRYLLFVGGSREAARLAGVPVRAVRAGAFILAAVICALAGVLNAGLLGAADPTIGQAFLLPTYAAAFLGATAIKTGRFNIWGTAVALYLIATLITGLQLVGAPFWVEPVFNGAALLAAVTFARWASKEESTLSL